MTDTKTARPITGLYDLPTDEIRSIGAALGGLSMSATIRFIVTDWKRLREQTGAPIPTAQEQTA